MRILVTGADGFIGRNLALSIAERGWTLLPFTRASSSAELAEQISKADAVIHLAGINRPRDVAEFAVGNTDLTRQLCDALERSGRTLPVAFASSIQAELDNPYGRSKKAAEDALLAYAAKASAPVKVFRLANVFGKWCKPNYNSAVATFCHNLARGLPVQINDPTSPVRLVYIDDVVEQLLAFATAPGTAHSFGSITPEYETTVGELVRQIEQFDKVRTSLVTEPVGTGFIRALYSTYVSYLPVEKFQYAVPRHGDQRGVFVEMLKTKESGQFSFFTAHPGITRGGHYHHSKTEKFLVIQGRALFKFRHMVSGATVSLETQGDAPMIVETVPGWAHDVTNIGQDLLIVMLWANEIFDRDKPDTISAKVF